MTTLAASSRRLVQQLLGPGRSGSWSRLLTTSTATEAAPVPKPVELSKLKDNFNDGTSIAYLEEIEQRYREDPNSVDRSWAGFFKNMGELSAMPYDIHPRHGCFAP